MSEHRAAIFLSGPIGVGKSTLGRRLADALHGSFVEGDEHARFGEPWYASSRSTARAILGSIVALAPTAGPVVVAYPVRCIEWLFYTRRLAERDIRTLLVSLAASDQAITAPDRDRVFSAAERLRIAEMISEGYDNRDFSDLTVRTDEGSMDTVLARLTIQVKRQLSLR